MEELYRGNFAEVIAYIEEKVEELCKREEIGNARRLDNIKWELFETRELGHCEDYDTIILYENDIVGYHYEIVEKEKTIEDIVNDTENEFTCALSGAVMYGSDTQAPRMLTDIEKEILKNYMSVYSSRLRQNMEILSKKEE